MLKSLVTLFILFFTLNNTWAQLWIVDPLEAIYPDVNEVSNYNDKWKGDFPKGIIADAHILVKLPIGSSFTITAFLNGKQLDNKYLSQLLDVPVEQNTGLDSRTEQFINKINPYVIRRAPFRIFEVIQPVQHQKFYANSNYAAFRLSVPPALTEKNDVHKIKIKVQSDALFYEGTFVIKIHDVLLPDLSESQFFYTNWFNLSNMEKYHQLERWSDAWFRMLDKYAGLMAHGRQNSIIIPNDLILWENNVFSLDEIKMLRFIDVFRNYGFKYFEAPHLLNRGENDDWGDPELKVAYTKKRYYTENGKEDIQKLMTLIKNFTTANGLTDNWLQHIADEPTSINAGCYKDVAKQLKEIYPEIKIMEATNARESIAGAIDIWCPIIDDFQENEAFFREREALGEKVLVYTCLVPGGPWLNRTMDMEKLRQVYFGWGAAFYNTGGYLHWGLNQYQADPYEQSVVKHPSPIASSNNYLPAGDTHIIYPGKTGPLSSIRFESHRIGCEDYELLQLLKGRKLNRHDKLINNLFRSYTDYNLEIKAYRKTKRKLLRYLN
jgi:hypothetical protein